MTADSRTEAWLADHGVTYTLQSIQMVDIDIEASHRNQARIGAPVDPQVAGLYTNAMRNGDEFPPVVVFRGEDDKWVFIDGNHRHAAYQAVGAETIPAYVVEAPSSTQRTMLTYDANTKHGKPTTLQERVEQAAWMVGTGISGADAARALNVPPAPLYHTLQRIEVDKRLERMGFDSTSLPKATRHALHRLRLDAVLLATAKLFKESKVPADEANTIVKSINRFGSEAEQLAAVIHENDKREAYRAATAGGRRELPYSYRKLDRLLNTIEHFDVSEFDPLDTELKSAMLSRLLNARSKLNRSISALS